MSDDLFYTLRDADGTPFGSGLFPDADAAWAWFRMFQNRGNFGAHMERVAKGEDVPEVLMEARDLALKEGTELQPADFAVLQRAIEREAKAMPPEKGERVLPPIEAVHPISMDAKGEPEKMPEQAPEEKRIPDPKISPVEVAPRGKT